MKSRPHVGVLAHALGALALVVAVLGISAWQRCSPATAVLSAAVASDPDVEARAVTPGSNEKACFASRTPSPLQAARARSQERPDLRFHPVDGAVLAAARGGLADHAALMIPRADRGSRTAMHEVAPELVGHRAANPVRGPPGRCLAST